MSFAASEIASRKQAVHFIHWDTYFFGVPSQSICKLLPWTQYKGAVNVKANWVDNIG
jgi:hypothetical protein